MHFIHLQCKMKHADEWSDIREMVATWNGDVNIEEDASRSGDIYNKPTRDQ